MTQTLYAHINKIKIKKKEIIEKKPKKPKNKINRPLANRTKMRREKNPSQ
jgi:hypothetical protein